MAQQLIVGLIVAAAACYACWRWMPAAWRRALAGRVAAGSQRAGLVDAERGAQLAASLGRSSGCGACDSRGSCGKAGAAPAADARAPASERERTAQPVQRTR